MSRDKNFAVIFAPSPDACALAVTFRNRIDYSGGQARITRAAGDPLDIRSLAPTANPGPTGVLM